MADPLAVGIGGAAVGAVVNHLLTMWRDSRSHRGDDVKADIAALRAELRETNELVRDVRENQAGLSALMSAFVVTPREGDDPGRPRRMR